MNFKPPDSATLLARVEVPGTGPCVATIRGKDVLDLTLPGMATCRDICELDDPAAYVAGAAGTALGSVNDISANSDELHDRGGPRFLAPCDLQVVKACGVTFAGSMVERVIEERAGGNPALAEEIRTRIGSRIGTELHNIIPGSPRAKEIETALRQEGLWSQYLEVGIGPDAEVFTKCPVLSSVGPGAKVGIHPASRWNNPEPELVLVVNSKAKIVGVTLGNDVNLRDFEGRSALLLGKSKDNNASSAIGPFIRLFDGDFTMDDVRSLSIRMRIEGADGFTLEDTCRMEEISRDPEDLVGQTLNDNHAYPDGVVLFCGTPFAPVEDRDKTGEGFTHHIGDVVTIEAPEIGRLVNTVDLSPACRRWEFSASHLMQNLAGRGLLAGQESRSV